MLIKFIKKNHKIFFTISFSLLISILFLSEKDSGIIKKLELNFLDIRNSFKYAKAADVKLQKTVTQSAKDILKSPEIAIIKIDNFSFTKFGQYPWPRKTYANPLDKFSIGQITASISWEIKNKKGYKKRYFRIYRSLKPIQKPEDLKNATYVSTIQSRGEQVFFEDKIFKAGKYYFAATSLSKDGIENQNIVPGENATRFPLTIKIKPALKPDIAKWRKISDEKLKTSQKNMPKVKSTIIQKENFDLVKITRYLNYPDAIFFDIFFLDKKNKKSDEKLISTFAKNANIYIDYIASYEKQTKYDDMDKRLKALEYFALKGDKNYPDPVSISSLDLPITPFLTNVEGAGAASPKRDKDDIIRSFRMIMQITNSKYSHNFYPSIPLLLAMKYFKVEPKNVEVKLGEHIILKNAEFRKTTHSGRIINITKRDLKIPIDKNGVMMISFVGGPGTFLENKDDLSSFANFHKYNLPSTHNKIYMVGIYEIAISAGDRSTDYWPTPWGQMYGIEVMANTLNTILQENFLHKANDMATNILAIIISLFFGIFIARLSIIKGAILFISTEIVLLVTGFFLYGSGTIINLAVPSLIIFFDFLAIAVYKSFTEENEKKYIRNQFGKFVNKDVVDELLKDPTKLRLGGERRELTILFSDIRSFTTISESMEAEDLVLFLNKYLKQMTGVVIDSGGTLDKYIGDAVMAFWGAPLPMDDHVYQACHAALKMMEELKILNDNWPPEKRINIGIGLNTGEVLVGNMGSESRMDYTIIGDSVNLAARLEGINKYYKTNIVISEFTYEKVKDLVLVRELDLVRVKGKNKPVKIFELLDIKKK